MVVKLIKYMNKLTKNKNNIGKIIMNRLKIYT